jgi:hypothetical protein
MRDVSRPKRQADGRDTCNHSFEKAACAVNCALGEQSDDDEEIAVGCDEKRPRGPMLRREDRVQTIAYWTFTFPIALENAAGFIWVFSPFIPGINRLHATAVFTEYLRVVLGHLGYPPYFKYIQGPWQLACAAALLAPRLPRVKEWAYAGAFFNYSSAIVSHLFAGDGFDIAAAICTGLTVISWALRPLDRRLVEANPPSEPSTWSWIASLAMLALLLILSLFLLPPIPKY